MNANEREEGAVAKYTEYYVALGDTHRDDTKRIERECLSDGRIRFHWIGDGVTFEQFMRRTRKTMVGELLQCIAGPAQHRSVACRVGENSRSWMKNATQRGEAI